MRFLTDFVERRRAEKKLREDNKVHNLALELLEIRSQIRAAKDARKPYLVEGLEREKAMVQGELERLCLRV